MRMLQIRKESTYICIYKYIYIYTYIYICIYREREVERSRFTLKAFPL